VLPWNIKKTTTQNEFFFNIVYQMNC